VYESGEASTATRVLVDEFLAGDPELRRQLGGGATAFQAASLTPAPDADRRALHAVQRALRRRKWLLGLALFFTMLPGWTIDTESVSFSMVRDRPDVALVALVAAAILWIGYARAGRRLRVTGLSG
jgi:hypothetical protein